MIFFNKTEIIDILHIINIYNYDIFAFDPDLKMVINNKTSFLKKSPWDDFQENFQNFRDNPKCSYIKLIHSDTKLGKNAYDYSSRSVIFYIENDKPDDYFLKKEIERRRENGLVGLNEIWTN